MKLCLCGCGQEVDEVHNYKAGHNFLTEECKAKKKQSLRDQNFVKVDRKKRSNRLCKCGCGQPVIYKYALYVKGHWNLNKPARNKGMHWNIREDSDKKLNGLSEVHRQKIGRKGILSPNYGKKMPKESIEKMRASLIGLMVGEKNPFYGKHHTDETKRIIGQKSKVGYKASGENHPLWLGGKSFEPYSKEFNKQVKILIRMRDNYTCQLCGVPEREYYRALAIHHIDYDKMNSLPNNLITLCNTCNVKVNKGRDYWTDYFNNLLKNRKMNKPYYQFKMENVNGDI